MYPSPNLSASVQEMLKFVRQLVPFIHLALGIDEPLRIVAGFGFGEGPQL